MPTTVKNRKATYRTRSVIGGSKNELPTKKGAAERAREEFEVDRAGYFTWSSRRTT